MIHRFFLVCVHFNRSCEQVVVGSMMFLKDSFFLEFSFAINSPTSKSRLVNLIMKPFAFQEVRVLSIYHSLLCWLTLDEQCQRLFKLTILTLSRRFHVSSKSFSDFFERASICNLVYILFQLLLQMIRQWYLMFMINSCCCCSYITPDIAVYTESGMIRWIFDSKPGNPSFIRQCATNRLVEPDDVPRSFGFIPFSERKPLRNSFADWCKISFIKILRACFDKLFLQFQKFPSFPKSRPSEKIKKHRGQAALRKQWRL